MAAKKKLLKPTTLGLLLLIHSAILRIERTLRKLVEHGPSIGLRVAVISKEGEPMPMLPPVTMPNNKNLSCTTDPKDAAGNSIKPTLAWVSSDPSVLAFHDASGQPTIAADTLSALAVSGNPGSATITVSDPITGATDSVQVVVTQVGTASINLAVAEVDKA